MNDLKAQGWVQVPGVETQAQMINLAKSLGEPVESDDGHLVKTLRPLKEAASRNNTLSSHYGMKAFPLHTDTAFWPEPCRYLVLRVLGDERRVTTIIRFDSFLQSARTSIGSLAAQSVWLAGFAGKKFYCSMQFSSRRGRGWRYDPVCLNPANASASRIGAELHHLAHSGIGLRINWKRGTAVVIDNWMALHGRGTAPFDEGDRLLERIYVRSQ